MHFRGCSAPVQTTVYPSPLFTATDSGPGARSPPTPPVHVHAAGSVHGEARPVVAEGHNVTWQQGTSGKTVSPELCAEERLSGGPAGGLQQATRNAAPHLQTLRERAQGGRGGGAAHWRGIDEEASGPALTWRPSGAPRWPGRTPLVAGRRRRDPRWRQ